MTPAQNLRLFFYGPGTGESIALCLPDGTWGLVDCYIPTRRRGTGVLEFLAMQKVERLAFLCLTHPHADHFLGAEQVLTEYNGRIDRIWLWDGLTNRELRTQMIVAAMARNQTLNEYLPPSRNKYLEDEELANGFRRILSAVEEMRNETEFRHVSAPRNAPLTLIENETYRIKAIGPDPNLVSDVEQKTFRTLEESLTDLLDDRSAARSTRSPNRYTMCTMFDEDDGAVLNSVSIVLQVEFGSARVLLLADAQGADERISPAVTEHCIKVAHHGSENGLGAGGFCCPPSQKAAVRYVIITPWKGRLPQREMIDRYREVAGELILTESETRKSEQIVKTAPTLGNGKLADGGGVWHGIEILPSGEARRLDPSIGSAT